jgi:hypothetical protein
LKALNSQVAPKDQALSMTFEPLAHRHMTKTSIPERTPTPVM